MENLTRFHDAHRPARLALALPSHRMAGALVLALARRRAVGPVGADWARLVTEGAHPAGLARARARLSVAADAVLALAALLAVQSVLSLRARLLAMTALPSRLTGTSSGDRVTRGVVQAGTHSIAT